MDQVECGNCVNRLRRQVFMHQVGQFQVAGLDGDVFAFHCTSCNGKAHLNISKDPRSGQTVVRQVRLTGTDDEYRPNSIKPNERVEIVPAYTLGTPPAAARRPQREPLLAPESAYTLGGQQQPRQLPPNHPMHPNQIRRRIQPAYRLQ